MCRTGRQLRQAWDTNFTDDSELAGERQSMRSPSSSEALADYSWDDLGIYLRTTQGTVEVTNG
jgi:hypothetical protein